MNENVDGGPVTFDPSPAPCSGATIGIQASWSVMIFWAAITS